jgi:hypothetical protein
MAAQTASSEPDEEKLSCPVSQVWAGRQCVFPYPTVKFPSPTYFIYQYREPTPLRFHYEQFFQRRQTSSRPPIAAKANVLGSGTDEGEN